MIQENLCLYFAYGFDTDENSIRPTQPTNIHANKKASRMRGDAPSAYHLSSLGQLSAEVGTSFSVQRLSISFQLNAGD